jgi:hypothetical protein
MLEIIISISFGFILLFAMITKVNNGLINKLNVCKKRIKDFTLKVNTERYHIINNVNDLEENFIINLIISKYPSSNPNFKVLKNDDAISIKYHNYSLLFTPNLINEFTNINDIYRIYNDKSTHIPEANNKKLMIKDEDFYNQNNPDILYKINSHEDLCKFILTYNSKRFLFIELELFDIIIDKYDKSYKTIKTTFYIKYNKNKFLELFQNINNYHFDVDDNNLIVLNDNDREIMKIDYYYTSEKSILDNQITYTYMNMNEYNGYYF